MNLGRALAGAERKLAIKNIPSAEIEAEALLAFVIKKDRPYLFAHPEKEMTLRQEIRYRYLTRRRLNDEPLAYLTGHKEFYGLDFLVNQNVLIPRPETELMIDETLKRICNIQYAISNILDVGTGSGCVIITLATLLKKTKVSFYGLDISRRALRVARKNAVKHAVDGCIHFLYGDLLNNIDKTKFNQPVLLLANLPYLTPEQVKNSPTIQKEPKLALLAGADGLDLYRRLFAQIKEFSGLIKKGSFLIGEIDNTQKIALKKLVSQYFPQAGLDIKNDLSGQDRLFILKW